jgi:hypothetical protein
LHFFLGVIHSRHSSIRNAARLRLKICNALPYFHLAMAHFAVRVRYTLYASAAELVAKVHIATVVIVQTAGVAQSGVMAVIACVAVCVFEAHHAAGNERQIQTVRPSRAHTFRVLLAGIVAERRIAFAGDAMKPVAARVL